MTLTSHICASFIRIFGQLRICCGGPARIGVTHLGVTSVLLLASAASATVDDSVFKAENITEVLRRACDYQMKAIERDEGTSRSDINYEWVRGAFMAGVLPLYHATSDTKYLDAVIRWGQGHKWQPTPPNTRHADFQCCEQTYLEAYLLKRDPAMLAGAKANIDAQISSPTQGRIEWWWCDSLFMAPPVLTRMYAATGERKYLEFLNKMYWDTTDFLYDRDEHLFYRDKGFFKAITKNGKKGFWSRGNGWVLAGLARLLPYLPKDDPGYPKFVQLFKEMSEKIASIQPPDGLWRPALLDPDDFATSETSGSAFFTFALAWGINNHLLDRVKYEPVVRKAWAALTQALTPEGKLGYVQGVAAKPGPVNPDTTREYAVGAFLLAGTEILKMLEPGAKGGGAAEEARGGGSAEVGDHLTSAARAAGWKETSLGPQITNVNVLSGCFGKDADGSVVIFATVTGNPAQFVIVDALTRKVKKVIPLAEAEGGYATIQAASGIVYIGTYDQGNLYSFTPATGAIENLGKPADNVTFVWDLEEGAGGKIYCACYDKSKLVEFDPGTRKFRDFGSMLQGEDYARGVAYDPAGGKIYVGIGSHPGLIELDPATGAKRNILPDEWKNEHFVYNVQAIGDRLYIKLDPSNRGTVYNLRTKKVEADLPEFGGSMYSDAGPGGEVYFTSKGSLLAYHPDTHELTTAPMHLTTHGRAWAWLPSADGKTSTLMGLMMGGKLLNYDPATQKGSVQNIELPQQPVQLQNLTSGPDGSIYTAGYLTGGVGKYDPRTGKSVQFAGIGQAEGIAAIGNTLIFGTYPHAIFYAFDVTKAWNKNEGNPREIFTLFPQDQDRSFGMLAFEKDKQLFVGTVPGYGILGGALTEYNMETGKLEVHRDVVPKQSVVSLVASDGLVIGGTTIWGGLGIEPAEKEAHLFGWDRAKKEKVFDLVPVAGARGITGLKTASDGLIYGWNEGNVFAFDPKTRKTVRSAEKFPPLIEHNHLWRGGWWADAPDGHLFTVFRGELYHLDRETLALDAITSGGQLELLAKDSSGALYCGRTEDLVRFSR